MIETRSSCASTAANAAALLVLGTVLLAGASRARAEPSSCPANPVRLDGAGGSMGPRPGFPSPIPAAFDQGRVNNCWANVACQMFDAYRYSHGATNYYHRSSPMYLLQEDRRLHPERKVAETGQIEDGWGTLGKSGSCNENDIFRGLDGTARSSFLSSLKYSANSYLADHDQAAVIANTCGTLTSRNISPEIVSAVTHAMPAMLAQLDSDATSSAQFDTNSHYIDQARPELGRELNAGVRERLTAEFEASLPERILRVACSLPGKVETANLPPLQAEYRASRFSGTIDAALNANKPLGLDICANFLDSAPGSFKKDEGFVNRGSGASYQDTPYLSSGHAQTRPGCEGHAVLAIGHGMRNGKCMVLLRNSWGTLCNNYPKSRLADCEAGKGNIWVNEDDLFPNTAGLRTW